MDPAARTQQPRPAHIAPPHITPPQVAKAANVGAALATVIFVTVLVNWSVHLQSPRYTSDFYDVQARRLFHGHLSVPLDRIGLEAFRHGDSVHLYFGVFPTILRMPLLLVTDRFDGRLTQPSMLLAWVVLLVAVRGLTWTSRLLVRGDVAAREVDRVDIAVVGLAPLMVAAATPLLFLAGVTAVYHEAIMWGVAGTLWAFDRLLVALREPHRRNVVWFGVAATIAMTSRASVGLAPCAAAGVVAVVALTSGMKRGPVLARRFARGLAARLNLPRLSTQFALALGLAALAPVAAHVAVNEARFGTALSPPYASQVWTELSADRRAALVANGGSLFNVRYVPSTVLAYLRPDGVEISRAFPYVWFDPPARVVGNVVFDTRDRTASLTALSPALIILGLIGAAATVLAIRRRRALAQLGLPVVTSVASAMGVLTIGFIAQRYEGDLLVPATLLALPAMFVVADALASRRNGLRNAVLAAGGVLLVWSTWANLSIALLYQRLYVPVHDADRVAFVDTQLTMDRFLPGSIGYVRSDSSPRDLAPAGRFHVTGDCRELWWSDGTAWIQLEPQASGASPLCRRLVDR